jgi:hemolysin activation/secretion protein
MGIHFRTDKVLFSRRVQLIVVALLSDPTLAVAQTTTVPSSGDVLKTIQPPKLPVLSDPLVDQSSVKARAIADVEGMKLEIRRFKTVGMTVMEDAELKRLLAPFIGPNKRFQELLDAAAAVKRELAQRGYFLADVIVPEQKIADGEVTLQVLEGRLGKVQLVVDPEVKLSRRLIDSYLSSLKEGALIETGTVERALFQIHDLRGVVAHSSFVPGTQPGTADLVVRVSRSAAYSANLDFDANGSIYTGQHRVSAGVDVNNLLGQGDLISVKGTNAIDGDLRYARVSLLSPVGQWGSKVGGAYTDLSYRLGTPIFDPLVASGAAYVSSLIGIHPFVRSRNTNFLTILQYDKRKFHDVQLTSATESLKTSKVGSVSFSGDFRDTFFGGGINVYNLAWTSGKLEFGTVAQKAADAAGRNTGGRFEKVNLSASRLQALADRLALYVSYSEQFGNKNYDASEKFSLGGPSAVRAYPQGEGAGDEGFVGSVELRYRLPFEESFPGTMVFTAFHDFGSATLIKRPTGADIAANSALSRRISGSGVGLNWEVPNDWYLRASVAYRETGDPTADHLNRNPRFYFQFSKSF